MGNHPSALSGIHPFKDDSSPPPHFIPPAPIANLALPEMPTAPQPLPPTFSSQISSTEQPQSLSLAPEAWTSITSDPQPEKFDELFVVKPPTPPPRKISYNESGKPNRRLPKQGFLGRGLASSLRSLRTLPRMISRPDLAKIRGFFKRKRVVGEVYPVPPDAEKPSPPSKPEVFHEQDEYFLLRWDPPAYDGGLPIIGYIIQHLELGLPQPDATIEKDDTQSWFSSEPGQVTSTEVLLNNLIPGTTYQFRVIAENLLGFSQPSSISTPIVFNPHGDLDDYFCPPIMIIPLDDSYTVIEHERLILTVEVTGQPYPIVKWYGNEGVELSRALDPLKYSVVSSGQRRVLTIHSVDITDTGVIRCVCENERGVVECSCSVVVEAPPHIRRVQRSELLKLENPYELNTTEERMVRRQDKDDEEMILQSGELARFKFMYSGSPAPNVCVYHEGDLVDGEEVVGNGTVTHERVHTEVTDNLITVKIGGVKRTDRGEWTVRLDNVLGEDSASVMVTVTDRPSEPGKPDVLQLSDNTVILKWDKPFDDGGCPVSGFVVEYFRSEWGVWLKACTTRNPYTKIRDLIPGSKYKFRIKAENLYGVSNPSIESVEILITDLASTLRSVAGDSEGALLMTTVIEEEEEAVKIEEEEPTRRKQGSNQSLNRVSAGTMTDLSALGKVENCQKDPDDQSRLSPSSPSLYPPHKNDAHLSPSRSRNLSQSPRSPSPRLLQVSLQPHVVMTEEQDSIQFEPSLSPNILPEPSPPRRSLSPSPVAPRRSPSPSPVAPPRTRTIIQQPTQIDEQAIALTRSQDFTESIQRLNAPVRPQRHGASPSASAPQQPVPEHSQKPQLTIPQVIKVEEPKKLYSRSEIIKSAAANELDYYYLTLSEDPEPPDEMRTEEPEEDPELVKVKEALAKDDHLFDELEDEEDFEYDFDKLQEEYEEDKKRGVVSRQDSGVSARSADEQEHQHSSVSRGESFNETEEDERPKSSMSDVLPSKPKMVPRMGSFERAQSEVVRDKPVDFDFGVREAVDVMVKEIEDEELVPPRLEPRRVSPSPVRTFGAFGGQKPAGQSGSKTMLHDRFTDYIAMKASSRNKKIGSSLRSLSSSRCGSNENVQTGSRDSGRSSMVPNRDNGEKINKNCWREFEPEVEKQAVKKLERSVSCGGKGPSLTVFAFVQEEDGGGGVVEDILDEVRMEEEKSEQDYRAYACGFVSTPEIYVCERGRDGFRGLEHSRSESHVGSLEVPDSGLKEKVLCTHVPGGVDYETEEEVSCCDQGLSGISEEGEGVSGEGASGGKSSDREVPKDRSPRRLRKHVSFGSSDVEEISWDDGKGRGRRGADDDGGEERENEDGQGPGEEVEEEDGQEELAQDEYQEEAEQEHDYEDHPQGDEEYEAYEYRGEDTGGFEYHPEDEFDDDGEVFEMDVEGLDPRVYSEEDLEGEEDSSGGVMYLLLGPEGFKSRDFGDMELGEEGGDTQLQGLLGRVDQFLEEVGDEGELRKYGGSYVEEIIEEEDEGDGGQGGEVIREEEEGLGEEPLAESKLQHTDVGNTLEVSEEKRESPDLVPTETADLAPIATETASFPDYAPAQTKVEAPEPATKELSVPDPTTIEATDPADPASDNREYCDELQEPLEDVIQVRLNLGSPKYEVQDITSKTVATTELKTDTTEQVISKAAGLTHPPLEIPTRPQRHQRQAPPGPPIAQPQPAPPTASPPAQPAPPPPSTQPVPPPPPKISIPSTVEISSNTSERIEPPEPPPRPPTFSYKHYMQEKQKQPQRRSSSRDSKPPQTSSLPTVKEEPSNPQNRTQSPESPYKPNMSVYFDLKPKPQAQVTPLSLRSSTPKLLSTQPPRSRSPPKHQPKMKLPVFKSPSEDTDPPVSIEEIRARIEEQRLNALKPLITETQETEEKQIVVKRRPPAEQPDNQVSPFMSYLFNASFYLMLSPMLYFIDSLYFGLLAILLVACVHFFIATHS